MDKDDGGLSEKILTAKELTKRAASRVGFHFKAIGLGFLAAGVHMAFPFLASHAFSLQPWVVGILTYFSLLLLFPMGSNINASLLGLVVALSCVLAGFWPLAVVCGGLIAFVIYTANRWKLSGGSLVALVVVLFWLGYKGVNLWQVLPALVFVVSAAAVGLGVLRPQTIPRWVDKWRSWRESRRHKKEIAQQRLTEQQEMQKLSLEERELQGKVQAYEQILAEIEQMQTVLTAQMIASVQTITLKTRAMIQCMRDDERDIRPAAKFLERYLPMISTSVSGYSRLASHQVESADFAEVELQTGQALLTMADAFSEMHQRLLNDDVDDLLVDLRVMNQLIKVDGYQVPQSKQPR